MTESTISSPDASLGHSPIGWWLSSGAPPISTGDETAVRSALHQLSDPVWLVMNGENPAVAANGQVQMGDVQNPPESALPILSAALPLVPDQLGSACFKKRHGLRYAYVAGAMANGITSTAMVVEMARAGMLGMFGAAGLGLDQIDAAIQTLQQELAGRPFGVNLIHSPHEPTLEMATVDLFLKRDVRLVSASAFLQLTPALVRYRVSGIHRDAEGRIQAPNRVIAKVSRVEIAEKFLSPPPEKLLTQLLADGHITANEAELAATVPMADDITAEADSGGHTDNRPAITLLPTMLSLRDRLVEQFGYTESPSVGLGGGMATPDTVAGAFAMGAAYVLVGSVHQACVESGTSALVRKMLTDARQADVTMAPCADMFELGVKVQVLKRGTMYAVRAAKLYDLYKRHDNWDAIPDAQRTAIERDLFKCSFDEIWQNTCRFFEVRDPKQVAQARNDPRHRLALVFRSYLGQASKWAVAGTADRAIDYQIWCGPAMGAFNEWARGTFLEAQQNRKVVTVALNLLYGACVVTRARHLATAGMDLPSGASRYTPLEIDQLAHMMPANT